MKAQAIIYARYSQRRNAESESIGTQMERCGEYCERNALEVIDKFHDDDDAISGKPADSRPGRKKALKAACDHRAVLVVYSLSRLARSTRDAIDIAERLDKAHADLASLSESIDTTTAMGRAFFTFLAVIAKLERELTAERTSDAMQRHQANGRRMSNISPFGWERDPDNPALMIENAAEQALIKRILALYKVNTKLRLICRTLTAEGHTCRGGPWHHTTLGNILRRAKVK